MIEAFEKRYGPVKLQQVPCGDDAQEISTSGPLLMEKAKLYRSTVVLDLAFTCPKSALRLGSSSSSWQVV